jgi:hypothetical protein
MEKERTDEMEMAKKKNKEGEKKEKTKENGSHLIFLRELSIFYL